MNRPSTGGPRRRRIATLVVVVLVLVNAALLVVALQRRGAAGAAGNAAQSTGAQPDGTAATSPAAATAGAATPTASSPPASAEPQPLRLLISAVSADVAWRATTGACPDDAAVVESTTDGGGTWRASSLRTAAVARLNADSTSRAFVVAEQPPACRPAYRSTRGGPGCSGVQVARVSSAGASAAAPCVGSVTPAPGQVALAQAGQAVWLQVGSAVYVSTDPRRHVRASRRLSGQ